MSRFNHDQQLQLVEVASRAPSVHNIQPARWCFGLDDEILLFEDTRRKLNAMDPNGQDNRISLGAAFEAMDLALSRCGYSLALHRLAPSDRSEPAINSKLRLIATGTVVPATRSDPLSELISRRHCFRGSFTKADPAEIQRLKEMLRAAPDVIPLVEHSAIEEIAALDDRYGYEVLKQRDVLRELYHWMRFSKGNALWYRDGLNGNCMAMSGPQRIAAALLLHPRVFPILAATRIAPLLTAQSKKTITACAIAIFHAPYGQDAFLTGRRFYRLWLEICGAGFALCPMSVLADVQDCATYLRKRWRVPEGARIVNVFRIGKAPQHEIAVSPRIPPEELLT